MANGANMDQDYDLIEKYLLYSLTPEEEAAFEQKLTDATFREKLAFQQNLKSAVRAVELKRVKEVLQEEEQHRQSPARQRNLTRILLEAAAVITLILLAWWLIPGPASSATKGEAIFAQYFKATKLDLGIREKSGTPADVSIYQNAYDAYNDGRYEDAIEEFDNLLVIEPETNDDILFFRANALLGTGETRRAIATLRELLTRTESTQREAATTWLLALALLKENQEEEGRALLEELIATDSFFKPRAQDILDQLDK